MKNLYNNIVIFIDTICFLCKTQETKLKGEFMNFTRKITGKFAGLLAAFLVCSLSLTNAFAGGKQNNFAGKTYVMTGISAGGTDVTSLLAIAGFEMNIELEFTSEDTCRVQLTTGGEKDEESAKYKVDSKKKAVIIYDEDGKENLSFSYTDDFSQLKVSAPIQDGMMADITLTEKGKAAEKTALKQGQAQPEIDYGSVKTNIFKGKTYKLTKFLINGVDASSLMSIAGETVSGSLKFIDGKNVILNFTHSGEVENDSGTYTIDYEKNTIIFDGDIENGKAVFYNKGSVISFDINLDDENMTLNLIFEK